MSVVTEEVEEGAGSRRTGIASSRLHMSVLETKLGASGRALCSNHWETSPALYSLLKCVCVCAHVDMCV